MRKNVKRAHVTIEKDRVTKKFVDPKVAQRELWIYQNLSWACPKLIDWDAQSIIIEKRPVASDNPHWRPVTQLRELLTELHDCGFHHRDVHTKNIVMGREGEPLLIDWEFAIWHPSTYSYDLHGPRLSKVDPPEDHAGLTPMWWSSTDPWSITRQWRTRRVPTGVARRPGSRSRRS